VSAPWLQPNVLVAVDVVLFTVRPTADPADGWQALLLRRDDPPFAGKWCLPGVLIHSAEEFSEAARRALRSKAGLDARSWHLDQLATFGRPERDTRGRVISVAHVALVRGDDLLPRPGPGITRAEWVPVRRLPPESLVFDHGEMLRVAAQRVRSKLRSSGLAFQLLPDTFTIPELRAVYAAILDPALLRLNTGNFKKAFESLFSSGDLVPTGEKLVGRVGRPRELYRFVGPPDAVRARELPWAPDDEREVDAIRTNHRRASAAAGRQSEGEAGEAGRAER
jgi:8-oxo-dGTP diphosphatase